MDVSTSIATVRTELTFTTTTISLPTSTYITTITSSFAVIDIYTKEPDQSSFVNYTEEWWVILATPTTSPTSSRSPTRSSSPTSTLTGAVESSSQPSYSSSQSPSPGSTNTTQRNQEYGSSNLSPGATAGIAVACVIAGLAIGAIAGFLFLRRRRRRELEPDYSIAQPVSQEKSSRDHLTGGRQELATGYGVFELESQERSQELATGYNVVELPDR